MTDKPATAPSPGNGETSAPSQRVFVYGSGKRAETFVYLRKKEAFDDLPEELRDVLGELRFVVDFELDAQRKLARADASAVLASLEARGYYLQLAPHVVPESVAPH